MPRITPIHYKKLVKVFELAGLMFSREEGDHLVYTKAGVKRPVIIPKYREIPVFIILNNLRVAGLTREDYFKLLAKT
jgi:predicted RNA binding protein YcfA (HicA-like mRNA interferase family)